MPARPLPYHAGEEVCGQLSSKRAALGGGLGVPCTGNPRYAGLMLYLRLVDDRAASGVQC
jgi:hypothetical protein